MVPPLFEDEVGRVEPCDTRAVRLDWRAKVSSLDEALATIRSGDHVFLGTACATPRRLIRALEDRGGLAGVQMLHFLTDGAIPVEAGGPWTRFRHRVFFVGKDSREMVRTGKADYIPISIAQVHHLMENDKIPVDVALVQVSPPDDRGFVSLGVSVDITLTAVKRARKVIAEVNPHMPRTCGETLIPIARIDHLVEVDTPVIEFLHEPSDAVAEQIARYVARIISDGSTLQIGLGRIPNEMLKYLTSRRDLGVHSDVITEPLVDLIERGVVTGRQKTVHPCQVVTSYCMGTRRLYDLIDGNPMFNFQPIDYVCDPALIARNHRMVSVTQAFAIDLTGQVCADQFDGEFYGGISTQPEFLRGAAASVGGKPIVCLTSTTDDGKNSRIRPFLSEGDGATIARSDVHYVVTEFGSAHLFGKSIRERAVALIGIAHPDFRHDLLEDAKRLGYVSKQQAVKSKTAYPAEEEREVTLKNGVRVLLRPTRPNDAELMQDLFYQLTPQDVYTRFFTHLKSLSVSNAEHLCNVDYENEMALAVVVGDRENEKLVASSCYYVDQAANMADVAYLVHPEWQGLGLGSILQRRMIELARSRGLRGFTADVLPENKTMLSLLEKSGCPLTMRTVSGVYEIELLFEETRRRTDA